MNGNAAICDQLGDHPIYETVKHLGQGTFGSVLHARNKLTGEDVAIKLIGLGERFYHKYVEREIMNHRQLVHPHIVAFKEVFVTPQYLGIVMEFVGGGNLQQWVERNRRLPEWQSRCFFQQITLALHYIHKALGIAHRDIKLGNILLNARYQVPILKLCDFGYSKNSWLGSVPKTRVGTAAYISPEVARASTHTAGYDTEKADVWSTGVTLYCMLAGHYPFSHGGQDVHLRRIKELTDADVAEALLRVPDASPACINLLRKMLVIDPRQRISLEGIMADPWFRQFLPDLSKLTSSPPKEVQSEEEVLRVLAEAARLSKELRNKQHEMDEEMIHGVADILEEMDAEGMDSGHVCPSPTLEGDSEVPEEAGPSGTR